MSVCFETEAARAAAAWTLAELPAELRPQPGEAVQVWELLLQMEARGVRRSVVTDAIAADVRADAGRYRLLRIERTLHLALRPMPVGSDGAEEREGRVALAEAAALGVGGDAWTAN